MVIVVLLGLATAYYSTAEGYTYKCYNEVGQGVVVFYVQDRRDVTEDQENWKLQRVKLNTYSMFQCAKQ